VGLEETRTTLAVEVGHLRERLGWYDLERPVQQVLQSPTQRCSTRLSMENCPGCVQDSDGKTGATISV
jgi:hypothetical protein